MCNGSALVHMSRLYEPEPAVALGYYQGGPPGMWVLLCGVLGSERREVGRMGCPARGVLSNTPVPFS